jgi:hypothetical protein
MAMQPVTDHAGQAARINPGHVTHVICYTDADPADPAVPERMCVGLATGEKLTFQYRTPADASRAAAAFDGAAGAQARAARGPRRLPAVRSRGRSAGRTGRRRGTIGAWAPGPSRPRRGNA